MKLSVIIIAKEEEEMIEDCLESVKWADEIIFIDTGSTDKTPQIAKRYTSKIVGLSSKGLKYAQWRNKGLKEAQGDWVLYLDADERVTPELKREIEGIVSKSDVKEAAFMIPRRNFLFGKEFHWGGWWPDYVKRLFRREKLKKWINDLHEEPIIEGSFGKFKSPFIHLQPETIGPMFQKSIKWSKLEAKMLDEAKHPPVAWWRVLRMGLTTLFDRLIKKQGFRDGAGGWMMSIYQAFHTVIVYIQLWEIQQGNEK